MGPIGFSETSVRHHHYSLRNNPEEAQFSAPASVSNRHNTFHPIFVPCPSVLHNGSTIHSRTSLHRPNVTLQDRYLYFPQNTSSFVSISFIFANVLWHYRRLSTLSQRIYSTVNKGCVNQQGRMALNESVYTLLHRKLHVETARFRELVLCEQYR